MLAGSAATESALDHQITQMIDSPRPVSLPLAAMCTEAVLKSVRSENLMKSSAMLDLARFARNDEMPALLGPKSGAV